MKDPLRGIVVWAVPENKEVSVTLFKDARTQVMEDKEWTFTIEDVRRNFTVLFVLCMCIKFLSTNLSNTTYIMVQKFLYSLDTS